MKDLLKVYAPYDNRLIDKIPLSNEADIEKALDTAYKISKDTSKTLPKYERIEILERLAELMAAKREELTLIAAEEGGKPYIDSLIEVDRAINGVKLAVSSLYGLKGGGFNYSLGYTSTVKGYLKFICVG